MKICSILFLKPVFPVFAALLLVGTSCKKFVDIPSSAGQLSTQYVFTNDSTAVQAVNGIYSDMINASFQFSNSAVSLYGGLSADELYYYSPSVRDEFMKNDITIVNHNTLAGVFWNLCYRYIYSANSVIEGAAASALSPAVKNSVTGQTLFIRAFCYFQLINLFGDIPLTTTTDYRINSVLPRAPVADVYAQIINDLLIAQNLLSTAYPGTERVKVNKWTATALLARVYLYNRDWVKAEAQTSHVINAGIYGLETNCNNVFLKTSNEAIWQLTPVNPVYNTYEANLILPAGVTTLPTYLVTGTLLSAFEAGDLRKAAWIQPRVYALQTLYCPYKYKVHGNNAPLTEYYMVFRLAEQYLIRAEARAEQNDIAGAQADLNMIRNRAGLYNSTATVRLTLLAAIAQERRIELFAEWGHRWYDLKRTGEANAVLGALKPGTWQSTDVLWPVPQEQINLNPILTQNPGY